MALAQIAVKDLEPVERTQAIPLDTVFSFRLFPVGSSTSIDIDTLSITVKETTSSHGSNTYNLTNSSSAVTVTSSGDSYSVSVDVDPDGTNNFSSNSMISLTINVSDTDGNAMRTFRTDYKVVDFNQLGALIELTRDFTEISVNYEQGRIDLGGRNVTFTYDNWSGTIPPVVYKNDIPIGSSGNYSVNYSSGKLVFSNSLSSGFNTTDIFTSTLYAPPDRVNCDYHYSCFTNAQLINFMKLGLTYFNASVPATNYTLNAGDPGATAAMLIGATYYLYNTVLSGFLNQQWRVQWGEEEWQELINVATTAKENAAKLMEEIKDAKRHTLTKNIVGIVVPSHTLPGGRSRFFSALFGHNIS